jgi:transcriptional regulator with XRE-family HTH domain
MDTRSEVREFLSTRRARITPDQAGLPAFGGNRRVPGLRREEVSLLAGVSVDYYTRLERGDLSGASDSVLDALSRALQLDEAETAHLFDLARAANTSPVARAPRKKTTELRPSILRLLDAMTEAPAIVRNNYFDYLAANALGRALYAPVFAQPQPNSARFAFLDPAAKEFYPEWDRNTQELVAAMRGEAGRNPFDRKLTDLVGELSTRSERFRTLWAAHNVALPPHRGQAHHASRGRGDRALLRGLRAAGRSRAAPLDLHRGARDGIGRQVEDARELGGDGCRRLPLDRRRRLLGFHGLRP